MKLLLVEDEQGIAQFLIKGLKEEGYQIDHTASGVEGRDLALAYPFDLVILDVMLPDIDGYEVVKSLREASSFTPVLMLTAKIATEDKVKGLDYGADDYITKPFSFDELLARIRALLRRPKDSFENLHLGDLVIHPRARKVEVNGVEVIFRPKEYAILEYMVRNRGKVVSRTQILENVWGYDFDPRTNVVDVHIKTIRQKLAQESHQEIIQTVRGSGYRIEESYKN